MKKFDHLYKQLSSRLAFESYPVPPLSGNDEHYLWNAIHNVATLPEGEYKYFLNAVSRIRELVILSRENLYRHLAGDSPDHETFLEEVEEIRTEVLDTLTLPNTYLICDIVSLPEQYYRDYLTMLDELWKIEKNKR